MMQTIRPEQLSEVIEQELKLYSRGKADKIKAIAKKKMSELVKKTKATAPVGKRSKHYRDSIASKKVEENDQKAVYMWYVKGPDYRLSHLLNNGHALRNGGRYQGTQFITKAYEPIEKEFEQEVKEACKND